VMRALGLVANRDVQREYIERIVKRAGVDLSPAAAWLLLQIERDPRTDTRALARAYSLDVDRLGSGIDELESKGLITDDGSQDGSHTNHVLTSQGCDAFDRIGDARRLHLTEVFSEWPRERHEELEEAMRRVREELVPGANRTPQTPGAGLT
jgi:DNA-binding MarR family transcriptional regulator